MYQMKRELSAVVLSIIFISSFGKGTVDPHTKIFAKSSYPSAEVCGACHKKIYDEWRTSAHANASRSPVFYAFEQKLDGLTLGTKDAFCIRCHSGTRLQTKTNRMVAVWKLPKVQTEGVTCISCHRVADAYLKTNGARRIMPGKVDQAPVNVGRIPSKEELKLAPHKVKFFKQIKKSEMCVSCHQVAIHPGIGLEVVWDQYQKSAAHAHGISCQQCHMSSDPGKPTGYSINEETGCEHHNHSFWGPSWPVTHPGLFPINPAADQFTIKQWLKFDYRAGWGTEKFEDRVDEGKIHPRFPGIWKDQDNRFEARDIITENEDLLAEKYKKRQEMFHTSIGVHGPFFDSGLKVGRSLSFHYNVTNLGSGHNLPSGSLGAQPQFWLNVVLTGPDGKRLWESGYLDSYGDIADIMSSDVLEDKIPMDKQLVNYQTKFLTTNVKGTDRENILPVNLDVDPLLFIRPATLPTTVLNHPPLARLEARSLAPLETKKAEYTVPAKLIKKPGIYRLSFRMRYRQWPIYFLKFINAPKDVIRRANETIANIHPYTVKFRIKGVVVNGMYNEEKIIAA